MARIDGDRPERGAPPDYDSAIRQAAEPEPRESEKKRKWPADAVAATCKYLSEGVRCTIGLLVSDPSTCEVL